MNVFISYTRDKDQFNAISEFASHLRNELRLYSREANVVMDTSFIQTGDDFARVIKNKLEAADALLIFVSPAWLQSSWCCREFSYFRSVKRGRSGCFLLMHMVEGPYDFGGDKEIAKQLKKLQHVDWWKLRHKPWSDEGKLAAITSLARIAMKKISKLQQTTRRVSRKRRPVRIAA